MRYSILIFITCFFIAAIIWIGIKLAMLRRQVWQKIISRDIVKGSFFSTPVLQQLVYFIFRCRSAYRARLLKEAQTGKYKKLISEITDPMLCDKLRLMIYGKANPDSKHDALYYLLQGEIFWRQCLYDKAFEMLNKIKDVRLSPSLHALRSLLTARIALYEGDLQTASLAAAQSLKIFRRKNWLFEEASVYFLQGIIYRISGVFDTSEIMLRSALKLYQSIFAAKYEAETMNELAKNLHENVNEAITVYGEPWTGGTAALSSSMQASQANMNKYEGYGCFNDKIRDALIKGGLNAATSKGWITNNSKVSTSDVKNIKSSLTGLILNTNKTLEVEKCVNYVTCHDNYTLYDRIKAAGIKDETTIKKMAVLANSVVFTSQGISFMLAGEEFLRTKQGNENSYNASYKVNELNYALKIKNSDVFANYQKLIAIKQNSNLFGLDSLSAKELVINTNKDGSMIYYKLTDNSANREYLIIHSNGVSATDKVLDLTGYSIYLNTLPGNIELTNETTISNYQTLILYKDL